MVRQYWQLHRFYLFSCSNLNEYSFHAKLAVIKFSEFVELSLHKLISNTFDVKIDIYSIKSVTKMK